MPLKRTPPLSPAATRDVTATTPSSVMLKPTDSSLLQQYYSAPDLSTVAESIHERKRRKIGEVDDTENLSYLIKEMFMSFSKDQEKRFNKLQSTIDMLTEQNTHLTASVELMSGKYDEFLDRICQLEQEKKEEKKKIALLEDKINFLEKKSRSSGIEIRNIYKKTGENKKDLYSYAEKVGKIINVDIGWDKINDIYRLKAKDGTDPIIIELTSVLLKEKILDNTKIFNRSKKTGEKLNTNHLALEGPCKPVYISETLTSKTQKLFHLARLFQKQFNYKFCWTSHGVVYLRKEENLPHVKIMSEYDIEKLRKLE
ncbi:unnamed protein product [Diatraea saccharalis]|uniref:FP protein C-terminal domain-containing protein n=1 Tax=Diatraea saccharalis TaxID=40085 RepID=A0A9N9WJD3_9NEOP|nr:unnamed protein product [Diatraea saccharalis]